METTSHLLGSTPEGQQFDISLRWHDNTLQSAWLTLGEVGGVGSVGMAIYAMAFAAVYHDLRMGRGILCEWNGHRVKLT